MVYKLTGKEQPSPQIDIWEKNLDAYVKEKRLDLLKDSFYLAEPRSDSINPDELGLMLVRIALADPDGLKTKENKYVFLQTYYDKGDFSSVDIVRLPLTYHKEIVGEYLNRILTSDISRQFEGVNPRGVTEGQTRFLIAGGFKDKSRFHGSSTDFTQKIGAYNCNDIAAHLINESQVLNATSENTKKGNEYIEKCLNLMSKHKLTEDFYSHLVDLYCVEPISQDKQLTSTNIGALLNMKAIDRAITEGKSLVQTLVEEYSGGLSREIMLKGVAENLKKKNKG